MKLHALFLAQSQREVVIHGVIAKEIILDHLTAVSEAQDKIFEAKLAIDLHDVPENRPPADFNERFGTVFGLLPHSGPLTTTENHRFHCKRFPEDR